MLSSAGVEASKNEVPFESWDALRDLALLSIKHHQEEGKNFRHFLPSSWGCVQARRCQKLRFCLPVSLVVRCTEERHYDRSRRQKRST